MKQYLNTIKTEEFRNNRMEEPNALNIIFIASAFLGLIFLFISFSRFLVFIATAYITSKMATELYLDNQPKAG